MTRKHRHWGTTEEAKAWASRARRRAEDAEVREQLQGSEDVDGAAPLAEDGGRAGPGSPAGAPEPDRPS